MFCSEMEMMKERLALAGKMNESRILQELIGEDKFSKKKKRMLEGERYFACEHDVLQKNFQQTPISEEVEEKERIGSFHNPNRSNHHCVNPFHHALVMQKVAYLVGKEPTIYPKGEDTGEYAKYLQRFCDERFNQVLMEWVVGASNKGIEYLHVYYDEKGRLCYCVVPAEQIIPIYDDRNESYLKEVIRYYDVLTFENGREKTFRKVEWWTEHDVTFYKEISDGKFLQEGRNAHWVLTETEDGEVIGTHEHGWGRVPFVQLRNNIKEMTDLQLIKGLIDAYDLISSEGTNNLLDLVELYWVIQGYGAETAGAIAKKLQINKAVQISDSSGKVEAKQVELPIEARLEWLNALRRDIFHFGMGVDTDSEDMGKTASGVALKFRYSMFYLKINGIVPEIKGAIRQLLHFVTADINRELGTEFDARDVQIALNTSGITDDVEAMEIITASKGLVSERTLLGKHPYIDDVNEELAILAQEKGRGEKV